MSSSAGASRITRNRSNNINNSGYLRVAGIVAKKVSVVAAGKPILLLLFVAVIMASTFYFYQRVALEYYYTYPYTQMGADAIANVRVDTSRIDQKTGQVGPSRDADEVLAYPHRAAVEHYRIYAETEDGALYETKVHALEDLSEASLQLTQYNSYALGWEEIDFQSVLIDENTARTLGVRQGDAIKLIQRDSGCEKEVTLTHVVALFGDTQGIILSAAQMREASPYEVSLYLKGETSTNNFNVTDGIRTETGTFAIGSSALHNGSYEVDSLSTKTQAVKAQTKRVEEFLPEIMNNAQQAFAVIATLCIALLYCGAGYRQDRINMFEPLYNMGLPRWASGIGFVCGISLIMSIAILAGIGIAAFLIRQGYHMELTVLEIIGVFVADLAACVIAASVITVAGNLAQKDKTLKT